MASASHLRSASTERPSRLPFIALLTTVGIGFTLIFCLYSLVPVTRPEDPVLASLFLGVLMAAVIVVQALTPFLVRRFSLRWVLIGSIAAMGVGAALAGFALDTFWLVSALAAGIGFGVLVVAGVQGVALLIDAPQLGRALGLYGFITMTTSAFGAPLGLQIAITFSPQVFGAAALLLGIVGALAGLRIPAGLGRVDRAAPSLRPADGDAASSDTFRTIIREVPWRIVLFLLFAVTLLSFGLTGLPVTVVTLGIAAFVVFATQAGNAVGRILGGEVESALGSTATFAIGTALIAAGACFGGLVAGAVPAIVAAALIGLGIGTVQTVTLHAVIRRMNPGRASVVWHIAVDGGYWIGGIIWGLVLAAGIMTAAALVLSAFLLLTAAIAVPQVRPLLLPESPESSESPESPVIS